MINHKDVHTLGSRLKLWRDALGFKQSEAAIHLNMSSISYQNYERDMRGPNAEAMEKFCAAGLNVNWLLTGKGMMLIEDGQLNQGPSEFHHQQPTINRECLALALETIEEGLRRTKRVINDPAKKAELVILVYDLFIESQSAETKDRVLKIVKLAA